MFKKATKKNIFIKIAITGPSGAGKTFSSLRLASGLGEKIALIDTENGSSLLYADKFNFDVIEMSAPYTTEKYIDAILAAEKVGYDVLIIDSITHAWAASGGLLDQKEKLDQRGGNTYTNWSSITKKHEDFKSAFLSAQLHVISTIRSKQDYAIEMNDKGKMAPRKIGLAPIQRDGIEYEYTTVFDVGMNNESLVTKDRTGLFTNKIFKVTEETGEEIKKHISSCPSSLSAEQIMNIIECIDNCKDKVILEKLWKENEEKILALDQLRKKSLINNFNLRKKDIEDAHKDVEEPGNKQSA